MLFAARRMLIGFAALGFAAYRRGKKQAAVAA
jgi:hypothetical protein